jgi:hypothetical protein
MRPCARVCEREAHGASLGEYRFRVLESQPWPSMPVCGQGSLQTSRRNAGMSHSVSCLRSILVSTGSVAISSQALEATRPRVASRAASLSQGQPGARGSLPAGARPTGFPVPLVCRGCRNWWHIPGSPPSGGDSDRYTRAGSFVASALQPESPVRAGYMKPRTRRRQK